MTALGIKEIIMIIGGLGVLAAAAYSFILLPQKDRLAAIQEWLKYAVTEAEKRFGSKTGELKLHMVYDMAIKQFPYLVSLVSFEDFKKMVDIALEWMRKQLNSNSATKEYVDTQE